jgi:hypothetical protein
MTTENRKDEVYPNLYMVLVMAVCKGLVELMKQLIKARISSGQPRNKTI